MSDRSSLPVTFPRWLWWLLAALVLVLLADQARFLLTYPVIDTGMWFGDETWTMLTVRAIVRTGVAHVPEALGSSLAHSNGLINGSIWLSGLLYGLPAVLFASQGSPVAIGRCVTLALSLAILLVAYRLSRKVGVSSVAALTGVLLLVASDAFHFSSHSARLDAATGLAVLAYLFLLVRVFERHERSPLNAPWLFLLTFLATLSLSIYVHVPTLIALPLLYALWRFDTFRSLQSSLAAGMGAILATALLIFIYSLSTSATSQNGSLSLLGSGYNQYYNVANSLPLLHPFSWRVQKINTIDRFIQVWQVAWPLVMGLGLGVSFGARGLSSLKRFTLILTAIVLLSWMLTEGPAVFYNIHVLPVLAVATAILLDQLLSRLPRHATARSRDSASFTIAALALGLTITTIYRQDMRGAVGSQLTRENSRAIQSLIHPVEAQVRPPLVLADQPAINPVAAQASATHTLRLMTNHLLLFGDEDKPLPQILREQGVDYLLLYSTARWQSPFRAIADSLYNLFGEQTGHLTDQARTYDEPRWNEIDTLRLYRAR